MSVKSLADRISNNLFRKSGMSLSILLDVHIVWILEL